MTAQTCLIYLLSLSIKVPYAAGGSLDIACNHIFYFVDGLFEDPTIYMLFDFFSLPTSVSDYESVTFFLKHDVYL